MEDFQYLTQLPGTIEEKAWIEERLETLSVRECCALSAALTQQLPDSAAEAVDCLRALGDYQLCFPAGTYEELGAWWMYQECPQPDELLPYANLQRIGELYAEGSPGVFVGNCYVEYPLSPVQWKKGPLPPQNKTWSVKLKLASSTVPEGVWMRLPDFWGAEEKNFSVELALVLDELQVQDPEDCQLLEARCILPQVGTLMEQYDSIAELIQHGDKLADFGADHLRSINAPGSLIRLGCIRLEEYAQALLENSGYVRASGGGYLRRNTQEFVYEYSTLDAPEMTIQ